MRPREIFLSHASADRLAAGKIVASFRAHGIKVWYSRIHLRGAHAWHDEIGRALARCDWFVVLLTPAAVKSEWVKREVTYAVIEKRYCRRIVPVLLRNCRHEKISWTLAGVQMVDFRANFRDGLQELLKIWNIEREPK
jgi:hypothetical protein